jgi:EmrB/QacA subfamily drug resistance transporter
MRTTDAVAPSEGVTDAATTPAGPHVAEGALMSESASVVRARTTTAPIPPRTTTTTAPVRDNRWIVLVIACLAQFMVVLDATIVNVALPTIQRGLHFSASNLQWVVNAYTLIFGGFLLLGGRAADLIGRKRLFMAGIAVFSLASLLNGLAQSSGMLIVGRGLQGLGGALVSPAALAIITTTFTDTKERTRALGVWSAIAAGGGAAGLLLGGALVELVSWPWIFIVNVPVGAITLALALRFVPESRVETEHRSFDLLGAITVTGGLVVLVYGIVKAQAFGWGSPRTVGLMAGGLALLGMFVLIESRSKAPLMRLSIFRVRTLAVADTVMLLVASGMFGMFFFASLYVQEILGYSPLQAGLAFLPVTAGIVIGAGIAQQLITRSGVRNVSTIGIAIGAAGLAWLTQLPVHGSYVGDLLTGLMPLSIGLGLTFVPITLLGTGGVSREDAGLASGLFNTAQQVGGSLGLAILSTLAASQTSSLLHGAGSQAAGLAARVSGYHVAFLAAAIMLAAGALILAVALRREHVDGLELDPNPAAAAA